MEYHQHAWEIRLVRASSLSLWVRLVRRRLQLALDRWRRRVHILSAQTEWKRLVVHHRHYLLRKLVLQSHWRRVKKALIHWQQTTRSFVRLGLRMVQRRQQQQVRLAWSKWRQLVRTERLGEEAAAWQCVLWTRKWDRTIQRISSRNDRERLVEGWVVWKSWYRRARCNAWRRGMALATRKHFAAWQRCWITVKSDRQRVHAMASGIVDGLVDDCITQFRWRQNLRACRRADAVRHIQRLLEKWRARVERQRLDHALTKWQSLLVRVEGLMPDAIVALPTPVKRRPTFPERYSAAYRKQRLPRAEKSTRVYRPSWR